ncbi:hypothetical protein DYGSA30_02100 [Dyella sp. GSA-30]|nr:hypothetical protein DYGSA30_02100 [Dyella sp. GSA-30]
MRRLSSSMTFFYKWVFPVVWLGFVGLGVFTGLFSEHTGQGSLDPMIVVIPIFMFAFGFFLFRQLLGGLVDEVTLDGDNLIVKKGDEHLRISLADVINVNSFSSINPRRISLRLRNSTRLGRDIDFIPAGRRRSLRFLGMTRLDPLAEELIDRIEALRRGSR